MLPESAKMLMVIVGVMYLSTCTADPNDCLKYGEKHGKHQEILGLIVEGCRTKFGVANPLTVKCVMQPYGAIDEDWGLHCDEFKQFVDDYINNKTKTEEMKKNAIKQCNCNENLDEGTGERERFGKTFVACWKSGLDKTCKDDAAIQGAPLRVEF